MSLTTIPHRLGQNLSYEQGKPLLNDNLEKVVQDIADFNHLSVDTGMDAGITITAGHLSVTSIVTLVDDDYELFGAETQALTMWVDGTDLAHRWPDGSALTAGQKNFWVSAFDTVTLDPLPNEPPGKKSAATTISLIVNNDTVSHTIYTRYTADVLERRVTSVYR